MWVGIKLDKITPVRAAVAGSVIRMYYKTKGNKHPLRLHEDENQHAERDDDGFLDAEGLGHLCEG
jgi:hypothetical protein